MEFSPDQYRAVYKSLPKAVKSFLISDEFNAVVAGIGQTYGLHVDTIGKLGDNASYMLMGLASPAQTLGELILAGIDAETAKKILEDLNQKMFIPVRDRVRNYVEPVDEDENEAEAVQEQTPATIEQAPIAQVAAPAYVPAPAPTYVPPAPLTISSVLPHPDQPQVQQTPIYGAPAPAPLPPAPVYVPQAPAPLPTAPVQNQMPVSNPEHPVMRTMATDMASVQPAHAPSWPAFTHSAPEPAPVPTPTPTAHVFTPSEPPVGFQKQTPPPPNLPGQPQAPIVKQYGVDPYRESV